MIRVVLLEPDRWRRRGIATVLDESTKFKVVDEVCADADVVVLSHRLIVERGIDEVARARDRYGCDVLVCAEEDDLILAARILVAGARGYYSENGDATLLCRAVELVHEGKIWGPREALMLAIDQMSAGGEQILASAQICLLRMLNEGLSNKEIAQRLGLAESTIKARMNSLYKRFGVTSRLQLLSAAIRGGMVEVRRDR